MAINFAGAAGSEAIERNRQKTGGGFYTPSIYWKNVGDEKFIQFLGDEDSFLTFRTFNMLTVGTRDDGGAKYESFISQTDPNVGDADSTDLITQRYGIKPKPRTFAIALEVEPQYEEVPAKGGKKTIKSVVGFEPVMRTYTNKDDEEVTVPTVGIVEQSPYLDTFFPWLADYAQSNDISTKVFKITKKDDGTDTRYYFEPFDGALDLEELELTEEIGKLHSHIENLADYQRQVDIIGPLPEDYILDKWQQKAGKKDAPAKKTRASAAQKAVASVTDDGDDADVPRSDQFAQLKARFAGAGK